MTLLDLRPNDASEVAHAILDACRPLPKSAHRIEFGAFDPYAGADIGMLGEADGPDAERIDRYVWFEETRAVTPLPALRPKGMPDTCPFGL